MARDAEKQRQYVKKHQAEHLDEVRVRPPKGTKERWRAAAEKRGQSLQRFIIEAVEKEIWSGD